MQYFLALFFLGLVQGLTEFLPISSSGHLVLFSKIFGIEESLFISIILHIATFFSIVVVYRKTLWQMITHPFSKQTIMLCVATIPTCVIVLILMPIIKNSFNGLYLPICFFISALFLYLAEKLSKKHSDDFLDYKSAIFMGIAQGFAVFPGVSRSGSTISAGLLCGKNKKEVANFSFLVSLPIIFLSLCMELYEIFFQKVAVKVRVLPTILAFVVAFLVGIFAIKIMIKITEKSNLKWFSLYLILISIVSIFILNL